MSEFPTQQPGPDESRFVDPLLEKMEIEPGMHVARVRRWFKEQIFGFADILRDGATAGEEIFVHLRSVERCRDEFPGSDPDLTGAYLYVKEADLELQKGKRNRSVKRGSSAWTEKAWKEHVESEYKKKLLEARVTFFEKTTAPQLPAELVLPSNIDFAKKTVIFPSHPGATNDIQYSETINGRRWATCMSCGAKWQEYLHVAHTTECYKDEENVGMFGGYHGGVHFSERWEVCADATCECYDEKLAALHHATESKTVYRRNDERLLSEWEKGEILKKKKAMTAEWLKGLPPVYRAAFIYRRWMDVSPEYIGNYEKEKRVAFILEQMGEGADSTWMPPTTLDQAKHLLAADPHKERAGVDAALAIHADILKDVQWLQACSRHIRTLTPRELEQWMENPAFEEITDVTTGMKGWLGLEHFHWTWGGDDFYSNDSYYPVLKLFKTEAEAQASYKKALESIFKQREKNARHATKKAPIVHVEVPSEWKPMNEAQQKFADALPADSALVEDVKARAISLTARVKQLNGNLSRLTFDGGWYIKQLTGLNLDGAVTVKVYGNALEIIESVTAATQAGEGKYAEILVEREKAEAAMAQERRLALEAQRLRAALTEQKMSNTRERWNEIENDISYALPALIGVDRIDDTSTGECSFDTLTSKFGVWTNFRRESGAEDDVIGELIVPLGLVQAYLVAGGSRRRPHLAVHIRLIPLSQEECDLRAKRDEKTLDMSTNNNEEKADEPPATGDQISADEPPATGDQISALLGKFSGSLGDATKNKKKKK